MLLVADPQLLGEERGNILTRWDSDRYLYNAYGRALQHVNPDSVVFLGDLMDEGSLADQNTFERYLHRFCKIFFLKNTVPLASKNVSWFLVYIVHYFVLIFIPCQVIFIPGDNDIGGDEEIVIREKVDRFNLYFNSSGVIVNENVEFVMVIIVFNCIIFIYQVSIMFNIISYLYWMFKVNQLIDSIPTNINPTNRTNTIKIMFSHIPLTQKWTKFTDKVFIFWLI